MALLAAAWPTSGNMSCSHPLLLLVALSSGYILAYYGLFGPSAINNRVCASSSSIVPGSNSNNRRCEEKAVLLASKDNRDGGWGPRNLTRIVQDYSETGQKSQGIMSLLGPKQKGVFLEAGAFNGEDASVSLGLELHHNWTGILIEPVPWIFGQLVAKRRTAFHVQGCISPTGKANLTEFMVDSTTYTSSGTVQGRYKYAAPIANSSKLVTINVLCYPLMDIVQAAGCRKLDVLYLDVQGAELDIIKTIRFDELDITLIGMEYSQDARDNSIRSALAVLEPHGFQHVRDFELDLVFQKGVNKKNSLVS